MNMVSLTLVSLARFIMPCIVPVYDARKTPVDFETDLDKIADVLPSFTGEIPFGSFVVVGYTASVYKATLGGGSERVPHLGCNILWVIVCGTPILKNDTSH
jgi:hypothetical protein